MQVIASPDGRLHSLNLESIFPEMLKVVAEALEGVDTDELYERALMELLRIIKDETGIDSTRLFEALQTIEGDPARGVIDALRAWPKFEAKFRSAVNRLISLQGQTPWLFNADGRGGIRLLRLKDVNGQTPISLDVQAGETVEGVGPADLMFRISGDAKAAMNLEVCDAAELRRDYQITGLSPATDLYMVYRASGEVGINGESNRSLSGGEFSVGAGAAAAASAHYIFQFDPGLETVRALVDSATQLVNPLDLNGVMRALAIPGAEGLREIRFQGARSGWLDLDMNFARAVSQPTLVRAPEGQEVLPLNQWLDATVKVRYRAETNRVFSVTRGDGKIVLSSRHGSSRTTTTGLTLGAGIELVGLGKLAGRWVEHLLPEMEELKATLEEYARPGDLLVEAAGARLDSEEDWVQSLGELLLGTSTANMAARELTKDLNERVSDALDGAVDLFDIGADRPAELAEKLTAAIVRESALLNLFSQDIHGWIEQGFEEGLEQFWSEFEAKIGGAAAKLEQRVQNTSEAQVAELLKPLEKFGARATDLVASLNAGGDQLIGPAIRLLQEYGKQRAKLVTVVEKAVKAKLAVAISVSRTKTEVGASEVTHELNIPGNGRFSRRTELAYRQWLLGRLEHGSTFGGVGTLRSGSFDYGLSGRHTTNITFDLGPLTFDWNGMIDSNVNFKVNLDGSIMVGEAGFRGSERSGQVFSRSGEASFSGGMPVIDANGVVTGEPFLVGYTYRNDDCSVGELGEFLESTRGIEGNGVFECMPDERMRLLLEAFETRGHRRARVEVSAAMNAAVLSMQVSDGMDEMLMARMLFRAHPAANQRLMGKVLDALQQRGETKLDTIVRLRAETESRKLMAILRDAVDRTEIGESLERGEDLLRKLLQALKGAAEFFKEVHEYQVWREGLRPPALSDNVRTREREIREWTRDISRIAYGHSLRAAKGLRWVIDASAQAAGSDNIPPDTLAFLSYFDRKLDGVGVLGALNLETSQKGDSSPWLLVSD